MSLHDAKIPPVKFQRPAPFSLSLAQRRLAAWLALLAIVLHAVAPFAHSASLTPDDPFKSVFCGGFSAEAKLALTKLPPDNPYQLLFKLAQQDCSLCQHSDDAVPFTSHPDHSLTLPLTTDGNVLVIQTAPPRARLNLAAAPPPSHAPPPRGYSDKSF